ncbi:MAG: enoyl-CoA hydratase/isomerase family protein [Deltaproteobacteria bacterium]|nr:enoyl-CoA hydratase/isomerase family protein [Candidatus Zymogenaceae bacterium]
MTNFLSDKDYDRSKITTERRGPTLIITLCRPDKRNALDGNMMFGIRDAVDSVYTDPDVRSIVIKGEGKGFSAGVDFAALAGTGLLDATPPVARKIIRVMQDVVNVIYDIEKPVIFAVHGFCFGMATELILAGDFRIAQVGTKIAIQETAIGFIPDVGGTARLTKLIGPIKAKELIMTAKIIEAEEAHSIQLFNEVVDDAFVGAMALADTLNKNAPLAVGLAKRVINLGQPLDVRSFMDMEGVAQTSLTRTEDVREGLMAKMERRDAKFTGK